MSRAVGGLVVGVLVVVAALYVGGCVVEWMTDVVARASVYR